MQYKRILMSCLIVILILCTSVLGIGATEEAPVFQIAVGVDASTAVEDYDSIVFKLRKNILGLSGSFTSRFRLSFWESFATTVCIE